MQAKTKIALDMIKAADLFGNVKAPINEANVKQILTWSEAVASFVSIEWENFRLQRQNRLTVTLHENFPEEYHSWNPLVDEIKTLLTPAVNEKIALASDRHRLPEIFGPGVQWDLLGACMEAEYSELVPVGLYDELLKWYLMGRLPCGWDGLYPEGRLMVL